MVWLVAYAALTVIYSTAQAWENRTARPGDPFWAPVWWIALTWPVWIVVIVLDLHWAPHWPPRRR